MATLRNAILSGIVFGAFLGAGFFLFPFGHHHHALLAGAVAGLIFGLTMYLFATSKIVKEQTQIKMADGESVIYSGSANHFLGKEAVGGKLYLLSDRLQFQSHKFNFQNHALTIDIGQIKNVGFYNNLGLIPNGLIVTTKSGQIEKFVLDKRSVWKEEIDKLCMS